MKKIFLFIGRIAFLVVLANVFLKVLSLENTLVLSTNDILNNGLLSIFQKDPAGNEIINFMKIIVVLSIYLLSDMNIMEYFADYSDGFKQIVKYNSKSRIDMIFNVIKTTYINVLKNSLFWCITIFILILLNQSLEINFTEFSNIIIFIFMNILFSFTTIIISSNSLTVIVLFLLKHIIFATFNNMKLYLIIIFLISIILYIKYIYLLGEEI